VRSIFFKIFVSYWLALALFVVLAVLTTLALRPPREGATAEAQQAKILNDAVLAFLDGGQEEARRYLRTVHDNQQIRGYLYDEYGHELTGRKPPEWIDGVFSGKVHTIDTFWGRLGPGQFLRTTMKTADGHTFVLVIELPPEHIFFGPHGIPALGLLIAVVSSGLVCFVLARYLTSPVMRLRAATQRLADGDLKARAGVPNSRSHDEMSELLRDFDRMAERLENLVNAQSHLLNDISHELRSPLARLNVALELARKRSGVEAHSALERIDLESNRLNQLIGRLLTIARLESGTELRRSPVPLSEIVSEISKDAAFEAQYRNCVVDCVIADECTVLGDPSLLHSAIENVVRNATRYTAEGTDVQVRLGQEQGPAGPEASVRVTDSGPGVPEDALKKLFRPFYRIDDARGRGTGGVGLGLAITERAVRLHGGSVRAVNRPQGGLMVEIRLPLELVPALEPIVIRAATPALNSERN
jgi:two-component system, OmpR family, sensor histidine kinase CpxA